MGHALIGGCGPLLWGKVFEISGSYNLTCIVSVGCYAIAILAASLIKPTAAKAHQQADSLDL